MHFYILFIVAFAIVISSSANASITEKRELPVSFKGCSNIITQIQERIVAMTETLEKATDYKTIRRRASHELGLFTFIQSAERNCCEDFKFDMNGENASIIAFFSLFADKFVKMESAFINKKPIIEKDYRTSEHSLDIIRYTYLSVNRLLKCSISTPPANRTPDETALFDKIDKVYSDAKAVYPILNESNNLGLEPIKVGTVTQ